MKKGDRVCWRHRTTDVGTIEEAGPGIVPLVQWDGDRRGVTVRVWARYLIVLSRAPGEPEECENIVRSEVVNDEDRNDAVAAIRKRGERR